MTDFSKKDAFKGQIENSIREKIQQVMEQTGKDSLPYIGACSVTSYVRGIFRQKLGIVPPSVEVACNLSEAILAPDAATRRDKIRKAKGLAGGATGMAMILGGLGAALGWGAGVMHTMVVFFTGASLAGPIGWVLGGVSLAAIAGYFAFKGDAPEQTERFRKSLIESVGQAIDVIWDEYGEKLAD